MTTPLICNLPSPEIFSEEEMCPANFGAVPKHIAVIMDGNRRWARKQGLASLRGHWEGAEALIDIVKAASSFGVKTLTAYSFSTENWERPKEEIDELMKIFEIYLHRKREMMVAEGIRLAWIGNLGGMPQKVQEAFHLTKSATAHCNKINLVLAVNYGGRDEIRRVLCKLIENKIKPQDLTEELIGQCLDTAQIGDPDLLIRTSGEYRVSNFLLWQISYTEFYTTEVLWPDFSPKHFYEAILAFQTRVRRRGN